MYCSSYSLTAYDQTRNLYSCIQMLYINAIVIPHLFVITIMAQRVGLTKNISEFSSTLYTLHLQYFTIIIHIFCYFYVYSLCNPNRFLYSILLIHVPTPIPADESMKDETPRTGILQFTHMTFSSRFIYFTYFTFYILFAHMENLISTIFKIYYMTGYEHS
jgi:hypothetical protein